MKLYYLFFIFLFASPVWAQQQVITGRVSDASGGLPGVTIIVKGTSVGMLSSADGTYSVAVPDDKAVLVFSLMGYTTQVTVPRKN